MMDNYWGEFLISPAPLELSMNLCSHGCRYCFANLQKQERTFDAPTFMRLLSDFRNRDTLIARLLKERYPVVVSNKSDPFARSNYRQTVPILEAMTGAGVPVVLQTKGGQGIDDVLSFLPPSCWYVTITTLDDSIRQRIEPGAPSVAERLALVEKLTARGHYVTVGLNPYVPEWCTDAAALLQAVKRAGAKSVWAELLHLNYEQVRAMSPAAKAAIGPAIIERSSAHALHNPLAPALDDVIELAMDNGLEVYSDGQPFPSDCWEGYRKLYPRTFPTQQDFVNWAFSNLQDGDVIGFDDFADLMCRYMPEGTFSLGGYVGNCAVQVWRTHKRVAQMTFRQLLAIVWADPRIKFSPSRLWCFAYAGERDSKGRWTQYLDDRGLPYLIFRPNMTTDYFTEVPS